MNKQKVIVITGASSGFGKTAAELMASKGHIVYGLSRRTPQHDRIHYLSLDLTQRHLIQPTINSIIEREGRIDVLINNAGMGIGGAAELASPEEIAVQMDTNFGSTVAMCQAVLPIMRRQGYGRIINISSIGGVMGLPYQAFYSASKFAIEGFSEALQAEVKSAGISVVLVEPGDFATGFTASRRNSETTLSNDHYGPIFSESLRRIEAEENGGLKPDKMAKRLVQIVECSCPRFRYVVANLEQQLSVLLKHILPSRWMINILRSYYKC